jgi:hypothetical protein
MLKTTIYNIFRSWNTQFQQLLFSMPVLGMRMKLLRIIVTNVLANVPGGAKKITSFTK